MQTTFHPVAPLKGIDTKTINVSRDDKPFGQMWTFTNTKDEEHPWHVSPLNGEHKVFWGKGGLQAAKEYMINL